MGAAKGPALHLSGIRAPPFEQVNAFREGPNVGIFFPALTHDRISLSELKVPVTNRAVSWLNCQLLKLPPEKVGGRP